MAEDNRSGSNTANDITKQAQQPSAPSPVSPPSANTQIKTTNDQNDAQEKPLPRFERPEWVIVYVTVGYAFVSFLTWLAIRKQVRDANSASADAATIAQKTLNAIERQATQLERQATEMQLQRQAEATAEQGRAYHLSEQTALMGSSVAAAQRSAEAAILNSQAVINAERARLLFEVEKRPATEMPGRAIFTIYAVNYGRLPAELVGYKEPIQTVRNSLLELPVPIPESRILPTLRRFLAPNDKYVLFEYIPASSENMARGVELAQETGVGVKEQVRMIYGEIVYRDGVSEEIRISRYCFRFEREPFSNIGGSIVPAGPSQYNECT